MARKSKRIDTAKLKSWLERVHERYHRPEYLGTDPLVLVHQYTNPLEQEIVGLIGCSLAYGKVVSINASIKRVLELMGPSPRDYVVHRSVANMRKDLIRFRHRWTDGEAMASLLTGMQRVIAERESLGDAFASVDRPGAPMVETLARWVALLAGDRQRLRKELLADPSRGSACKRLHLYLRWMVRADAIDPGCWHGKIDPSRLMIPLDVHMFRFARTCGFTRRNTADAVAVSEITSHFGRLCPEDPVRYDFALTRPGIMGEGEPGAPVHLS